MSHRAVTDVPGLPGVPGAAYSQAIVAGDQCYISGQLPLDPATGQPLEDGVRAQTHLALRRVFSVLDAAGFSRDDLVAMTVLMASADVWPEMNAAFTEVFTGGTAPSRTAFAAGLPPKVHVEIQAVAVRDTP